MATSSYEYAGNTIPAPGLSINNPTTTDQELKYSTVGYSQKGGTLAAGQGVLPLGTVLVRNATTKLWEKYNGTGNPGGVLRKTTDTGASGTGSSGYQANIAFRGSLKLNLVSSANGGNLAAAVTALGAKQNIPLNIFSF